MNGISIFVIRRSTTTKNTTLIFHIQISILLMEQVSERATANLFEITEVLSISIQGTHLTNENGRKLFMFVYLCSIDIWFIAISWMTPKRLNKIWFMYGKRNIDMYKRVKRTFSPSLSFLLYLSLSSQELKSLTHSQKTLREWNMCMHKWT